MRGKEFKIVSARQLSETEKKRKLRKEEKRKTQNELKRPAPFTLYINLSIKIKSNQISNKLSFFAIL